MVNDKIAKHLKDTRDSLFIELKPFLKSSKFLKNIFKEFSTFNLETYQDNLETEIKENLLEWWLNPEKGIVKEEKLYAILFEFDTTWWNDRDASSYGIHEWDDFKLYEADFEMGYHYDFASEFYAMPGLTLNFYDCFGFLDDDANLKKKHKKGKYLDIDGFEKLAEYVKYAGYVKVQETFHKLHQEKVFKKINKMDKFMFIIGEHDIETNPLLIIEK